MQTTQNTKIIAAFEARRKFGKILHGVLKGDKFVVEKNGERVAAVVPIEVYEQWRKSREAFFQKIRSAAKQANLSEKTATELADKAVENIRHK